MMKKKMVNGQNTLDNLDETFFLRKKNLVID